VTVAYEPIWAIGTGLTASSEQVGAMTRHIRNELAKLSLGTGRVLYGGSVNADNASSLMTEGDVDGFLVGGASLKAESFMTIIQSCDECYDGKR
jgi:triosephosphate isomerase